MHLPSIVNKSITDYNGLNFTLTTHPSLRQLTLPVVYDGNLFLIGINSPIPLGDELALDEFIQELVINVRSYLQETFYGISFISLDTYGYLDMYTCQDKSVVIGLGLSDLVTLYYPPYPNFIHDVSANSINILTMCDGVIFDFMGGILAKNMVIDNSNVRYKLTYFCQAILGAMRGLIQ